MKFQYPHFDVADNNVRKTDGIVDNPYQYVLSAHGTNLTDSNHSWTDQVDGFLYSNYWLSQNCKFVDPLLYLSWRRNTICNLSTDATEYVHYGEIGRTYKTSCEGTDKRN